MLEVLLFQSLKETTGGDTSFKNTLKVYQLKLYCLTAVKYLPETSVSTIHFRHLSFRQCPFKETACDPHKVPCAPNQSTKISPVKALTAAFHTPRFQFIQYHPRQSTAQHPLPPSFQKYSQDPGYLSPLSS